MAEGEVSDVTKAATSVVVKTPAEVGNTGLVRTGGYIQEEFLRDLQGDAAIKVYKEMRDNDPILGALLFAIGNMLRQIKWTTKPGKEDEDGIKKAQFLEECMNDMSSSWVDVISEATSMFPFGWSLLEPVYKKRQGWQPDDNDIATSKYDDGRIGWRKMPLRAQESKVRWEFDDNGGLIGMWQYASGGSEKLIPITSSLLFRTQTYKGNPEGRSIFRNAYRPWYFKKRIEEIEAIGVERDLAGLPIARIPAELMAENATAEQKAVYLYYQKMVTNVRRDTQEGMVLPSDTDDSGNRLYEFELLSASGARQFDTDTIISRYSQHMSMTALADWLMLGHENVGSFALSANKSNLFGIALGAWKDSIVSVFNNHAVPRLFRVNGFPVQDLPMIEAEDIETPDLAIIGSFVGALSAAGVAMFPNDDLLKRLYQMAGFPEPTEDQLQEMREAAEAAKAQIAAASAPTTPQEDAELADLADV